MLLWCGFNFEKLVTCSVIKYISHSVALLLWYLLLGNGKYGIYFIVSDIVISSSAVDKGLH